MLMPNNNPEQEQSARFETVRDSWNASIRLLFAAIDKIPQITETDFPFQDRLLSYSSLLRERSQSWENTKRVILEESNNYQNFNTLVKALLDSLRSFSTPPTLPMTVAFSPWGGDERRPHQPDIDLKKTRQTQALREISMAWTSKLERILSEIEKQKSSFPQES